MSAWHAARPLHEWFEDDGGRFPGVPLQKTIEPRGIERRMFRAEHQRLESAEKQRIAAN